MKSVRSTSSSLWMTVWTWFLKLPTEKIWLRSRDELVVGPRRGPDAPGELPLRLPDLVVADEDAADAEHVGEEVAEHLALWEVLEVVLLEMLDVFRLVAHVR